MVTKENIFTESKLKTRMNTIFTQDELVHSKIDQNFDENQQRQQDFHPNRRTRQRKRTRN